MMIPAINLSRTFLFDSRIPTWLVDQAAVLARVWHVVGRGVTAPPGSVIFASAEHATLGNASCLNGPAHTSRLTQCDTVNSCSTIASGFLVWRSTCRAK